MKFIHLSDLHLGKRVNEYSMLEDQEYILKKIINIVDAEKPDGVIIAGDVYDKSVPAAEAVQLFDNFLVQLAKRKLEVFVISGNHDSPERIAFGARIMDASGIHMSPVYDGNIAPISMQDEYGTVNLLDIYKVSIGGMKPIHTIPNQIRHVLETTYRFEGSCGGFDDYILNNEILGKNGCLYSLIEDHSHGGLRTSKGYTDNMLIDSCRMVVDFIASKYPGQIEEAKRLSA